MRTFREILGSVCKRPALFVGTWDFHLAAIFLIGYDAALWDLRPEFNEGGLSGFREWLAVRLDSCVRSVWPEIIAREDTGPDKFEALVRLYDEFARDRGERGLEAILADFERLKWASMSGSRERSCWCELPPEERGRWRPKGKGS